MAVRKTNSEISRIVKAVEAAAGNVTKAYAKLTGGKNPMAVSYPTVIHYARAAGFKSGRAQRGEGDY